MAYDAHQNYRPPPRQYYDQPGYDDAHYNNGYGQAQQYDGYGYDDGYQNQNGYYDDQQYAAGYGGGYQQQQAPPPRQNGPQGGYGRMNGGLPPQNYAQGPPPGGAPRAPPGRGGGPGAAPRGRGGYGPPPAGRGPPPRGPPPNARPPQDYPPNGDPMGRGRPPPQNAPPRGARQPTNRPVSPEAMPFDNPFPVFPNKRSPPRSKNATLEDDIANMIMETAPGAGRPSGEHPRQAPRKMSKASDGPRPSLDGNRPRMPGYARGPEQFERPPPPARSHTAKPEASIGGFRLPFGSPEQPRLQRSATMPQNYEDNYGGGQQWQEPGAVAGYYGPESESYIPPRPTTAGGDRRPPPQKQAPAPYAPPKYQPDKRDTVEDVYDTYYNNHSQHGHDHRKPRTREDAIEEDMPDFDSIPTAPNHRRGLSFEDHLSGGSGNNTPQAHQQNYPPPEPRGRSNTNYSQQAPPLHRSRSQPDFNRGQNPNYVAEMPGDAPPVPNLPRSQTFNDQGGYGGYGQAPPPPRPGTSHGRGPPPPGPGYGGQPPSGPSRGTPGPQGPPGGRPYGGRPDQLQRNATDMSLRSDPGPNARYNNNNAPPQQPLPDHRARGPPVRTNMGPSGGNNMMSPGGSNTMSPGGNNMMSPADQRKNNMMSPVEQRKNEDALPHHPTPVRPGLQQGAPQQGQVNSGKPIPVRQHNDAAVVPGGPSPAGSQKKSRRVSDPITPQTLAKLRNDAQSRPQDKELQLRLAKKLVEAAAVLADEGGRADPKTRNKNRERYTLEAHKIVKKLAHNKYPEAMFYLADSMGSGQLGLDANEKEAFSLYLEAAKLGHCQAAYRTAVCCEIGAEDGGGTRKDPVKAVQWYKRAAALGDVAAMYKMGMIQLKGLLNQPKSPHEAIAWLKRAAEHADEENPHALHELALLYSNKATSRDAAADVVARDERYAFDMFKKAAELGYKFSQFRLGEAFEYGHLGCPVDPRNSIAWYTRAAAQEEHQSELALSGWYLTGNSSLIEQSDTEAYLWARKAACADPPLPKAMFAMGYYTEVGIGCPRSLEEAKRWYGRAASYNFPKARERLEELKKGGAKVQKGRERLSRSNQKEHEENCVVM